MLRSVAAVAALLVLSVGSASNAQDVRQEEILDRPAQAVRASTGAAEWQVFSRSSQTAYLVDPSTMEMRDGVTSIQMARAPLNPAQGEPGWTLETYQFRCSSNEYRMTAMTDFNQDGSPAGPEEALDETFDRVSDNGLSGYLKGVACDSLRLSAARYASVQAWIASGRK